LHIADLKRQRKTTNLQSAISNLQYLESCRRGRARGILYAEHDRGRRVAFR
jgi:hypothetical protein